MSIGAQTVQPNDRGRSNYGWIENDTLGRFGLCIAHNLDNGPLLDQVYNERKPIRQN
jgi:hypothetical protein